MTRGWEVKATIEGSESSPSPECPWPIEPATCPCLSHRRPWNQARGLGPILVSRALGSRVVLTGAGCRGWVQGRAVVAEVTAACLSGGGCRVAVGRAAGTELVPGGRLVEAQLTSCGREGGCHKPTEPPWAGLGVQGLGDSSHSDPGLPGGFPEGQRSRPSASPHPTFICRWKGCSTERTCDLLRVAQQVEGRTEAGTLTPESKPRSHRPSPPTAPPTKAPSPV